jgi:hypothetical protein
MFVNMAVFSYFFLCYSTRFYTISWHIWKHTRIHAIWFSMSSDIITVWILLWHMYNSALGDHFCRVEDYRNRAPLLLTGGNRFGECFRITSFVGRLRPESADSVGFRVRSICLSLYTPYLLHCFIARKCRKIAKSQNVTYSTWVQAKIPPPTLCPCSIGHKT